MAKDKPKPRKVKPGGKAKRREQAEPVPQAESRPEKSEKRTNAQVAYDFLRHVQNCGYALWREEHRHEIYAHRAFIYLLDKDVERTEDNATPEDDLYHLLGQWLVSNENPKSRRETRNILDELLFLMPRKRFNNSTYCVPKHYRQAL